MLFDQGVVVGQHRGFLKKQRRKTRCPCHIKCTGCRRRGAADDNSSDSVGTEDGSATCLRAMQRSGQSRPLRWTKVVLLHDLLTEEAKDREQDAHEGPCTCGHPCLSRRRHTKEPSRAPSFLPFGWVSKGWSPDCRPVAGLPTPSSILFKVPFGDLASPMWASRVALQTAGQFCSTHGEGRTVVGHR